MTSLSLFTFLFEFRFIDSSHPSYLRINNTQNAISTSFSFFLFFFKRTKRYVRASQVALVVKNLPANSNEEM